MAFGNVFISFIQRKDEDHLLVLTSDCLLRIRQTSGGLDRIFLRLIIPARAEQDSSPVLLLRLCIR